MNDVNHLDTKPPAADHTTGASGFSTYTINSTDVLSGGKQPDHQPNGNKASPDVRHVCHMLLDGFQALMWVILGALCLAFKRTDKGIRCSKRTLILMPWHASVWAFIGMVYWGTGDRARALVSLRRAVALNPNKWRYWLSLGDLCVKEKLHAEAIAAYERVLNLKAGNRGILAHIAAAWRKLGR